jgi:hypothetical protein
MTRSQMQTREDLIALAIKVLRAIRDVERIHQSGKPQHPAMRFHLERGVSIVTGAVDVLAPDDGWLVKWEIPAEHLQGDPGRVTSLAVLLADAALEALANRRAKEPKP